MAQGSAQLTRTHDPVCRTPLLAGAQHQDPAHTYMRSWGYQCPLVPSLLSNPHSAYIPGSIRDIQPEMCNARRATRQCQSHCDGKPVHLATATCSMHDASHEVSIVASRSPVRSTPQYRGEQHGSCQRLDLVLPSQQLLNDLRGHILSHDVLQHRQSCTPQLCQEHSSPESRGR